MSGPSKVIVLDPDLRAGRLVQLGFEREGIACTLADPAGASFDLPPEAGAILVGGANGAAVDLVRRARQVLKAANLDIPIISAGRDATQADLRAAGADEVVARPAYLRDVVTVCRILHGVPSQKRDHLVGNLAETTGVYTLVRAFGALGRSGVLTLIRGLRRGEVRFYEGEVTSAEVGLIHGQAALHQLLLWTDARFDFAYQDIVRRGQIPLTADELFADAERFLEGVRDAAGTLSPATVLEQNVQRIHDLGKQIPTEVYGVLRMFDSHRVLADILEDSPYRVFETLRVAQKAVEVGLLRRVESQRPKSTWRAVLAIDEWLVGNETRDAVVERTADLDSGPTTQRRNKPKAKKSRVKRAKTPASGNKNEIDWGALVPRVIGAEVGPLSGVVPALAAHGEVDLPTRDRAREKLEALMDTGKRDRIFPKEVGMEPKVVIAGLDVDAKKEPDEAETVGAGKKAKRKKAAVDKAVADKAAADSARERAEAERVAKEKIAAEMARIEAERVANERARVEENARIDSARIETARAEAERIANEKLRFEAERAEKARVEAARVEADQTARSEVVDEQGARELARIQAEQAAMELARIEAERVAEEARRELDRATAERAANELARREAERRSNDTPRIDERARIEAMAGDTLRTAPAPGDHVETAHTEADRARIEAARAAERIAAARAQAGADAMRADAMAEDTLRTVPATNEAERIEAVRAEAERIAAEKLRFEAERAARAEADRLATADAERTAKDKIAAEMARIEAERVASEQARLAAEQRAAEQAAAAKAAAEHAATEAAAREAAERELAESQARARENAERMRLEQIAGEEAAAKAAEQAAAASGNVVEDARAYAARVKAAAEARKAEAGIVDASHATSRDAGGDARDLVRQLVAEAVEPTSGATTQPVRARPDDESLTKPFVRTEITPPITVSEAQGTSVAVSDLVTVSRSADTSVVTASPRVLITERVIDDATPQATDDEPSDGVIRSLIATADTARVAARERALRAPEPEHDGPPVKEATGEIGDVRVRTGVQEKVQLEESITVEPSILVADLAAAHTAVSAAFDKAEPPPGDAASSSKELEVSEVRRDAVAFSEDEEDFFKRAEAGTAHVPRVDSFDDLDDGYQPPTFWDRVFGRDKKK